MDLDSVTDELYGLAPEEFIAARDAVAKQARADGDPALADGIKALRKPTVAAWLANQMAREHAAEIGPLLELGQELRDASEQLHGPALRSLSDQRSGIVRALLHQARALASTRGRRIGEDVLRDVEETFNAALVDPAKADALAQGRLVERLTHSGFAVPSGVRKAPTPAKTTTSSKAGAKAAQTAADRQRAARRKELENELAAAWQEASDTKESRDKARQESRAAARAKHEAERRVADIRRELQAAEDRLRERAAEHEQTTRAEDKAEHAAQQARRQVSDLQRDLDSLAP